MQGTCANCGRQAESRCSTCKVEMYCSRDCQNEHWKVHKKTCREIRERTKRSREVKWLLCGSHFRQQLQNGSWLQQALPPPVTGLRNQGNTCYLNAILQCLVHTKLLCQLVQEVPSQCLRKQDARQWLAQLQQLIHDMNQVHPSSCAVSNIAELITTNKEFVRGRQADAHEAFMFIVSRILEACIAVGDGSTDAAAQSAKDYSAQESLERSSLLGHVFGMDLGQRVRCRHCSYSSETARVEYCLCLSCTAGLDDRDRESFQRHSGYSGGGFSRDDIPGTTLEELLRSFSRLERIDGYKCEKCRQTGCVRSAYIKRPPNNLVFYIDRRQDSSRFGKINRAVQFPQELDATPFVEESCSGSYQLYGIVVHQDFNGSTFFGHYIAFVKDRERGLWHRVDDDEVSEVPWSVVKEQRANLLFYAAKTVSLPPCEDGISEPIARPKSDDTDGMGKGAARRVQEEHNVPVASVSKPGFFQQDARRCANETSEDAATSPKLSGGFFDFDDLEEKETEMAQRALRVQSAVVSASG